ncbi:hypothetical protein ILUMI_01493 [Ignelater luminosus]|uniref:Dynein assembly factor 3, axonemal n=1 Tax=Ignelater luminosus TaxID=2038154 RepID=A0A8K0DK28_IGNLU|nr:hypothetical protein ILUMI_01493 [Ignelater luminosus]
MFWGLTPALDLQAELKENGKLPEEINILIVGGADCRHVLKTVAQRYRHENIKINFYIIEAVLESVAKQLLLLNVALQPEEELGLVQKTRYFMELYGNMLVRPAVAKYLKMRAYEFVEMITNLDYMKTIMPFINLDLKYRERDYLENVFKFWCSSDEFDVCDCWDRRMRKTLGIRYDTKMGAFEWDLHMRFHSVGGMQVCTQEYTHWRATGVAFVWLESEVSKSNRSFVSAVIPNGEKFAHCGYLGDMETGPFVTYGLDCEDPEYLRRSNGLNAHRATDVTERNLRQYFYEIQNNEEYVHQKISDINMGHATFVQTELKVIESKEVGEVKKKKSKKCVNLENVEINFMSTSNLKLFRHKENYHNFFNLIYFGSTYLKYFEGDVIEMIASEKGLLLIENQMFVLSHRDKQLEEFGKNMQEKLELIKSKVDIPFDVKKDVYAKFVLKGDF